MTTFTDFIIKSGRTKITCVRDAKKLYQDGYEPAHDFWRLLRKGILDMHRRGRPKSDLDQVLIGLHDRKKINLYPMRVSAYKKWIGRKKLEWVEPRTADWSHEDLDVRINPELGLLVNGKHHTIKLYFKKEPLSKSKVDLLLYMLQSKLNLDDVPSIAGILDVANGKLIVPTGEIEHIEALLIGEASSFSAIWKRV